MKSYDQYTVKIFSVSFHYVVFPFHSFSLNSSKKSKNHIICAKKNDNHYFLMTAQIAYIYIVKYYFLVTDENGKCSSNESALNLKLKLFLCQLVLIEQNAEKEKISTYIFCFILYFTNNSWQLAVIFSELKSLNHSHSDSINTCNIHLHFFFLCVFPSFFCVFPSAYNYLTEFPLPLS